MCLEKLTSTCVRNYATCVSYEGYIPEISDLSKAVCVSLDDTTEDIYKFIEKFHIALSTDTFDDYCIEFDTNDEGEITQREVNLGLILKVCELESLIEALGGGESIDMSKLDLDSCDLNLTDFVDACGESITSVCGLLQALVDKVVSQQGEIDTLNATISNMQTDISNLETTISTTIEDRLTALEAFHP